MSDGRKAPSGALSKARLERLVEEATVDAYGESEQVIGLFTMIDENLELPFVTRVLGMDVTVERIDVSAGFLGRKNVRLALAGAFALHAYGFSRATSDLDFVTEARVREHLVKRCAERERSVFSTSKTTCASWTSFRLPPPANSERGANREPIDRS